MSGWSDKRKGVSMSRDEVYTVLSDGLNKAITQALEDGGDPSTIREILEDLADEVCGD